MSAWILRNRLEQPVALRDFAVAGYRFNARLSAGNDWVFTRDQAE
jgi:cytoplasmic iron level regulating protein YaaA (DUF328/UPF0246 family)